MIPPFEQPALDLGPLHVSAFGVLMVVAIVVGAGMIQWRGGRLGLVGERLDALVASTVAGGFIVSHLVAVLFYHPEQLAADPLALFKVWGAMTSYGGFIGAIAGIVGYVALRIPRGERWRYADAVAWGFPFGWVFGRLGCTLALDHPGIPTTLPFGFQLPSGVAVHNLGLYELILMILICALFWITREIPRFSGFWMCSLWLIYSPARFALDALRIHDARYLGLTPGQWAAGGMLSLAAALMAHRRRVGDRPPWGAGEDGRGGAPVAP